MATAPSQNSMNTQEAELLASKESFPAEIAGVNSQEPRSEPISKGNAILPQWKPGSREWLMLLCLAILSTVVALDTNIVIPVLPALAKGLSGDAVDTFWAGTSYLLTCAVFQPFIVSLSDIFGRRQLLFFSVSLFTIGTIVCCLAQNFTHLFAGRSVQGIGGGGITALALVITTDIVPLRFRPTYYGLIQVAWAIGTMTGPLVGGLFADKTTWRWVFYVNFPFCAVGLVMVPIVVRLRAKRGSMMHRVLHVVDWFGAFLFIASSSSFLIGTSWGGQQYAWSNWRTVVPIVLGVAGMAVTVVWERYGAETPFIRLWLFKDRSALCAYACAVLQGTLMFSMLYCLALYLQACRGLTATVAGAGIMCLTFSLLASSILCGIAITRTGRYRWAILSGWSLSIASSGLLIVLDARTPTYGSILSFVPLGTGHGFVLISLNFAIQALARERDGAYAAGFYTFARTFGFCLGVTVSGTVLHNRLASHLRDAHLDASIANDAERYIIILNKMMRGLPQEQPIRDAYAGAFRNVFEVTTGLSALGGILSLFIKQVTLDRELESEHVFDVNERNKNPDA